MCGAPHLKSRRQSRCPWSTASPLGAWEDVSAATELRRPGARGARSTPFRCTIGRLNHEISVKNTVTDVLLWAARRTREECSWGTSPLSNSCGQSLLAAVQRRREQASRTLTTQRRRSCGASVARLTHGSLTAWTSLTHCSKSPYQHHLDSSFGALAHGCVLSIVKDVACFNMSHLCFLTHVNRMSYNTTTSWH